MSSEYPIVGNCDLLRHDNPRFILKRIRLLNVSGYEFAAQGLDEIGRMAGGWWKSAKA